MAPEQTRKLQLEILDLLVEFDRVCRKQHIQYYLSGGTLLGAIRHHGFIPWDDDADVEMFRDDYDKFRQICDQELQTDRFFFQDSTTDGNYHWTYGKLRKKHTRYIRTGQGHLKQQDGICIDIFILENASDNRLVQRVTEIVTHGCRKMLWSPVGAVQGNTVWQRSMFKVLRHIPYQWILKVFDWTVGRYRNKKTHHLGYFHTNEKNYRFEKSWYSDCLLEKFENHEFYIPNGYQHILAGYYGNYMELPPENDRHGSTSAEYILFSDGTIYGKKQYSD